VLFEGNTSGHYKTQKGSTCCFEEQISIHVRSAGGFGQWRLRSPPNLIGIRAGNWRPTTLFPHDVPPDDLPLPIPPSANHAVQYASPSLVYSRPVGSLPRFPVSRCSTTTRAMAHGTNLRPFHLRGLHLTSSTDDDARFLGLQQS
jgi:hypothetical protein